MAYNEKLSNSIPAVKSLPLAIFRKIVKRTTPDPSLNKDSISSIVFICNPPPSSLVFLYFKKINI